MSAEPDPRVIVVTGGASGLGLACVEHFSSHGARVVVVDMTTLNCSAENKQHIDSLVANITAEKDIQGVAEHIKQKHGRLDAIINCAGIAMAGPVFNFTTNEPHSLEMFTRVLQVNTVGTFNVIRLLLPLMAKNEPDTDGQRGVIINVASVFGLEANAEQAAYAASKAAVAGMTLPLAREFGPYGIRVVAIAPGFCDTPMTQKYPEDIPLQQALAVFPKRMVRPEEFAHLCQSIIDNHAINAEVIRLDGGVRISLPPGL